VEPYKPRSRHGEEYYIQDLWVNFLENKKWHVERLIGNAYQSGIPDLYIGHLNYGCRWIDIKVYGDYSFTKAQKKKWPIWEKYGIGIWIIGAESRDSCTKKHMLKEYEILFQPPNWRDFWLDKWDQKPDIDKMLDGLENE
jgi:hypothetical protein